MNRIYYNAYYSGVIFSKRSSFNDTELERRTRSTCSAISFHRNQIQFLTKSHRPSSTGVVSLDFFFIAQEPNPILALGKTSRRLRFRLRE